MSKIHSPLPVNIGTLLNAKEKKALIEESKKSKFGIENLKKLQIWKAALIKEIWGLMDKAKKGRKPNGWDAFKFIDDAFDLGKIMKKYDEIGKEWTDLDESEKQELQQIFAAELNLGDDHADEFGERTNFVMMVLADYITYLAKVGK